MPDARSKRKLSGAEQLQVCLALAQFKKPTEIVQLLQDRYNKNVSLQNIRNYQTTARWKAITQWARHRWLKDTASIPIAHEKYRLEELQKIKDLAMEEWRKGGINFDAALGAISAARKEVAPDKPAVQFIDASDRSTHYHVTNFVEAARAAYLRRANSGNVTISQDSGTNGAAPA